jgi:anthranilate phosphoribosyltransferase
MTKPSVSIAGILADLRCGRDLSRASAGDLARALLGGHCADNDVRDALVGLYQKGESVSEILGFIDVMRANMTPVSVTVRPIMDSCGTGGSGIDNRFNVSTAAAFVLGAMGYYVVKHGNRGSRFANGSIDFLDALGVPYALSDDEHNDRLQKKGVTFLFARLYHTAVRHVAPIRQQLSHRSIFNIIGPFCNPASPSIQIVGTPSEAMAQRLYAVGESLSYDTFAVVTGESGLDDCSTVGRSRIWVRQGQSTRAMVVDPLDWGIRHTLSDITVGGASLSADNAAVFRDIRHRQDTQHPIAVLIAFNVAVMAHIMDPHTAIDAAYASAQAALVTLTL